MLLLCAAVDHMNMGSLRAELMLPPGGLQLGEDEDEDELETEMMIMGQTPSSFTKKSSHLAGGCCAERWAAGLGWLGWLFEHDEAIAWCRSQHLPGNSAITLWYSARGQLDLAALEAAGFLYQWQTVQQRFEPIQG